MFPINYVNIIVDCMHSDTVMLNNTLANVNVNSNKTAGGQLLSAAQNQQQTTQVFKDPVVLDEKKCMVRDTYHR